ncbi:MAG: hypothetical protein WCX29_04295 [Candidatus Peribacteraceae bacterium]|mgnify:CR=1 FL=1
MITIGDRIKEAIDYMEKGHLEHALTPTCIAIDLTSKKTTGNPRSSKSDYKKFVAEYMWLISYMGLPGIMAQTIRVKFSHPDILNDTTGHCGVEDVVYHVIRCGLVHSTGIDGRIVWSDSISIGSDDEGNLILNKKFIWGLIGSVIFCPINIDENIDGNYWIRIDDFKFFIQELWGRTDLAQRIINQRTPHATIA